MTVSAEGVQEIRTEQDVVLARQQVRKLAVQCGLRLVDQTKIVTAASELARNAVVYGGGGVMEWELLVEGIKKGMRMRFIDQGPRYRVAGGTGC